MPQTNTSADPHVAVLAFPFSTHAAPLLTIIRRLAAASPKTHFTFFNTAQSNQFIFPKYNQDQLCNVEAYNVPDGVPEGHVFVGKPQEDIELFMKVAAESFERGIEDAVAETGRKVSCLVSDGFFYFAAELAEKLGVPWIPFWTAGANSLSTHVYTDFIRKEIGVTGVAGREEETLDFIPGMSKVRIRDLQEGIVFGNLESLFSRMLHQMGKVLPQATAVFINSFEDLHPAITNDMKTKFNKFLNIGPLNLTSPLPPVPDVNNCIPWLNMQRSRSVAYISFGSVTIPPQNELVALAEALEASETPFIWSLKENSKANLPEGFLERIGVNGIVVPWVPQVEILAHSGVGVFITHCGWNSLMESIAAGVPMICRPFFGDQRLNVRMVKDEWEIGVKVEGGVFTKNGTMRSMEMILSQEKGKEMRKKISRIKELAERAIRKNGRSTENFKTLLDIVSRPIN